MNVSRLHIHAVYKDAKRKSRLFFSSEFKYLQRVNLYAFVKACKQYKWLNLESFDFIKLRKDKKVSKFSKNQRFSLGVDFLRSKA